MCHGDLKLMRGRLMELRADAAAAAARPVSPGLAALPSFSNHMT